jgi:hypothetical protein
MVAYQLNEADLLPEPLSAAQRANRAAKGPHADVWCRFKAFTMGPRWASLDRTRAAVLTNLIDVLTVGDAQDFVTLSRLVRSHGHERVAGIHSEIDSRLGSGDDLPVLTAALRVLADRETVSKRLFAAGLSPTEATDVATTCYQHVFWLLVADTHEAGPTPVVATREDLVRLVDSGDLRLWRAVLAPVAANPWVPLADQLVALAEEAGRPEVARAFRECRAVFKMRQEAAERATIAREIRRLVAVSGRSQREFATYVGTSPSRLSTYATGKVTPSAAMLLRIQRAARALQDESDVTSA